MVLMEKDKITISLPENQIRFIISEYFSLMGLNLYDWQIYKRNGEAIADIRLEGDINALLTLGGGRKYDKRD
jgi:hypothetical protein